METELKPAFYALEVGTWRDYVTLLHPPYTVWHLSYVVLGASVAPVMHLDRLAGLVLAFFLAVGLGAHALDELRDRPLHTHISDSILLGIATFSLMGALTIGIMAALIISLWAIPFVIFGVFAVIAYNLELSNSRFHSDIWFGLAWGAFPALTGFWANAERLNATAFLVAASCLILSLAQRELSKHVRTIRRKAKIASGQVEFQDGHVETITIPYMLAAPETALRLMSLSIALLALGLLVARL